ncbi:hypothetical protein L3Q82_015261 [Scortum barcoo]|uniref:Uncharacterized protein n=1 Tax=Scortum barcoo TaxID=214431 RepID=A0ACB8VVC1_9TELE|nr:hypothetical protein L3Q82_015261 [Scortum barcoo]
MEILLLLSLLCCAAFSEKHSLKYILTSSYGVKAVPEFVAVSVVDGVQAAQCDSSRLEPAAKTDWMETFFKENDERLKWYTNRCRGNQYHFRVTTETLMQRLNQTGGVHIFQRMNGCEWDDETEDISGFNQYGYDGEDFLAFDPKTLIWVAPKPQAVVTKHELDRDRYGTEFWKRFTTSALSA